MGTHSPRKGVSFEEMLQARQDQAMDKLQARELRQIDTRTQEAEKAKQYGKFRRLRQGSTARKFADAILDEFPQHAPPRDGSSFTEPAQVAALTKLSDKDVLDEHGIQMGLEIARAALSWARGQLRQMPKQPTTEEPQQSEDATTTS
jgi:hypothetical protein